MGITPWAKKSNEGNECYGRTQYCKWAFVLASSSCQWMAFDRLCL